MVININDTLPMSVDDHLLNAFLSQHYEIRTLLNELHDSKRYQQRTGINSLSAAGLHS